MQHYRSWHGMKQTDSQISGAFPKEGKSTKKLTSLGLVFILLAYPAPLHDRTLWTWPRQILGMLCYPLPSYPFCFYLIDLSYYLIRKNNHSNSIRDGKVDRLESYRPGIRDCTCWL